MRSRRLDFRLTPTDRAIALVLTWALPGSTAFAVTPPPPAPLPAATSSARTAGPVVPLLDESESAAASPLESSSALETAASSFISPHEGDDHDDGLRPILECVVRHSPNSYTAYFGFKNESDQALTIEHGPGNSFSPWPQDRGQPTTFPRGRSPYYPSAAFSVPFNGSSLTWTLRGPGHHTRSVTARSSSPRCQALPNPTPTPTATPAPLPSPTPPLLCASPVFGPQRFTRTCDDNGPTVYNRTFTLPAGATGPFTLRVQNGDTQGRNKTTSAEVKINGVEVVGESDFSNNVVTFTKTLPGLAASNQLYVRVKGAPNSTFTLEICGANQGDSTPPVVDWLTPAEGEILKDPAPLYRVRYADTGSGLDLATLKILIDGADQTASFNRQSDEASYDSLAALGDGAHVLRAEIKDVAGNAGIATRNFRVDATAPTITLAEPSSGSLTRAVRPQIRIAFADAGVLPSGVDAASLRVSIDGVDATNAFTISGGVATGVAPLPLADGSHRVDASISDRVGNDASTFTIFIIDTVPPVITTVHPAPGQSFGATSVSILVQYADNQALNLGSFTATLDGSPLSLTVDADAAEGLASSLADGPHALALSIADQAGNVGTSTVSFTTDTGNPEIFIVPANGQAINSRNPEIVVTYRDAQGIAPGSLKITVNGVVRTADFTQTALEARATLVDPLPAGLNTIMAEVRDGASNPGAATSSFTVDVTPPVITVVSPAGGAFLNDTTPDIDITLQDEATGIATGVTRVFVDGVDVTADFVPGATGLRGALGAPLTEGPHTLEVLTADGAANPTTVTVPFHIDLTPPTLDFASPRVDGYTNDPTPEVWLRLADPQGPLGQTGGGVDLASARVLVLSEVPGEPDTDITPLLSPTAVDTGLRGELAVALADGSHRLRATVRDTAGNESSLTVGFVVDTEAPALVIDAPQSDTFLNSAEPTSVRLYIDTRSGVASDLVQVTVDGIERAASLVAAPGGASVTLSRSLGFDLAEGPHLVEARVVDLAGNAIDAAPVTFGVDTVAPVATVQAPAPQSFTGAVTPAIQFLLADAAPSSGMNADFAKVLLDGVDITAGVTFTSTGSATEPVVLTATGTAPTPLGDGVHTLRITAIDNANNPVELITSFTVDTHPPTVTPEIPEEGRTVGGGAVSPGGTALITGALSDVDPGLVVICASGATSVAGTIANGMYSCQVRVGEGLNQVSVTVTDSTGHSTTSTRSLTVDTTAPVVIIDSPSPTDATAAEFISVSGHVQDATPVAVSVNGVTATVTPSAQGVPATFVAANVPVGPGPLLTLAATAIDAASNPGSASVTIAVDRTPPAVVITKPSAEAYLQGGLVEVELDVTDRSTTMVEVNGAVAFDPVCSGTDGVSLTCHFKVTIPLIGDGAIVATAVDAAGNVGRAQTNTILDSMPPNIVVVAPTPLLVTNASTITVAGVVTDASPFTLTVNGQTVETASDGSFSASIPAGAEGPRDLVFAATDAARNQSSVTVTIVVDRTPPSLTIVAPLAAAVVPASTLAVSGTVSDATTVSLTIQGVAASVVGQAYSATLSGLQEGLLTLTVRATDAAGNESVLTRAIEIDLGPPAVTITSPAPGSLTREATAILGYTVLDRSPTSILVNDVAAGPDCPGLSACDRNQSVSLVEGDNTFSVAATDAGGRTTAASVTITRDSTPPLADLQTPETVSRTRGGTASATATDNLAMQSIEIRLASAVICSGVSACSGVIPVDATLHPGDALTLTLVAIDRAGNVTTSNRTARVTADSVLTGTVLDDRTSLPLSGATVTLLGAASRSTSTDESGRYNLPASDTSATLHVEMPGFLSVDRAVTVIGGSGTVPLDARLTRLADPAAGNPIVPPANPTSTSAAQGPGPLSITVPPGAHRVTLLSSQGLPNLLPLGFSPLVAWNWTTDSTGAGAQAAIAMPVGPVAEPEATVVRYDTSPRDWRIVATALVAEGGRLTVDLAAPGSYALLVPDLMTPPLLIGAIGDTLTGLDIAPIPATATSESRVSPAILPPTGGTAIGFMRLDSPSSLPSGTIVQADVEETYTLTTGEEAGAPRRSVDVVAYRHTELSTAWGADGSAATVTGASTGTACAPTVPVPSGMSDHLCAAFPITPSRTYATSGLKEGRVHLDLLAGRETARGVVGGNEAVAVTSGQVRLSVAAGSLAEDTAIGVRAHDTFSPFVPTTNGITPLGEVAVDFSTATLNTSASLTFRNAAAAPGDTLVVAQVDRAAYDGIPRLQVIALAELQGPDAVSVADPGLAGITLEGIRKEGVYVLLRLPGPIGFISGRTTAGGSPVRALVSSNTLPFVATSTSGGYYAIPAAAGPAVLTARVPGQSLLGTTPVTAVSGSPVTADILLEGAVTQATITPASGAVAVEVNESLTLTSPVSIALATVVPENIALTRVPPTECGLPTPPPGLNCAATLVAVRLVLSGSGRQLSIIPIAPVSTPQPPALEFSTDYRLTVTGLQDTVGGLVTAPVTTFRTKDDIKPVYDLTALTFSFPDANGLVKVTAPSGTFPPGTTILVINGGNGFVASFTAGNDGQVGGDLPATINDVLLVSVTDPFGNNVTFERGEYVDPLTGETAIGSKGGTVRSLDGKAQLDVPEGAFDQGVSFKVAYVSPAEFESRFPGQQPNLGLDATGQPLVHLGGALSIETNGPAPVAKKEIDLSFPVPSDLPPGVGPRDAFYYIFQRVQGPCPNNAATCAESEREFFLQTLDDAFVECRNGQANCAASDLRVKTASPPFSGFEAALTFDGTGAISSTSSTHVQMVWTVNQETPGDPLFGVITGYVYQPIRERRQGVDVPVFQPVAGACVSGSGLVTRVDPPPNGPACLSQTQNAAITGPDGRYTLFDPTYRGGPFVLKARHVGPDGTVRDTTATGFESDPQDAKSVEELPGHLRGYRNRAMLNLSFPIQDPPPPRPEIGITVCEVVGVSCIPREGLALVGRDLRIRVEVKSQSALTLDQAEVNGAAANIGPATSTEPAVAAYQLLPPGGGTAFTPTSPGIWIVRVRAVNALGDPFVESVTFRVVGSNGAVVALPDDAPGVITRKTLPPNGAASVGVTNLNPEVYFTEPVKGLTAGGTVQLIQETGPDPGPVDFQLIGVGVDAQGTPKLFSREILPTDLITSITLKPRRGLKLDASYTILLSDGIADTDTPPKPLPPFRSAFSTFKPLVQSNGQGGFTSPGIGIVGNKAFIVQGTFFNGLTSVWDVEDPALPKKLTLGPGALVAPRPIDVAADPAGEVMAGVAVTSTSVPKPGSVIFVSGQNPAAPVVTGAVSVTSSGAEGFISRIAFHKGFVYAATFRKGIQVIDVARGQNVTAQSIFQAQAAVNTDGRGFGQDAVVGTIPLPSTGTVRPYYLGDIAAADIQGQPLVAATGDLPLVLADPLTLQRRVAWLPNEKSIPVPDPDHPGQTVPAPIVSGSVIAVGRVGLWDLAVLVAVVGGEVKTNRLIAIDVRNPSSPQLLGNVDLAAAGGPLDLTLRGTTAIVTTQAGADQGEAIIVELVDPANPYIKGRVPGAGGRAAVNRDGQVVTTGAAPFQSQFSSIGGVQTLFLESACVGVGRLLDKRVVQQRIFNPVTGTSAIEPARIQLELCQRSQVTVAVGGVIKPLRVDGGGEESIQEKDLPEGRHVIGLSADILDSLTDEKPFTVLIRSVIDEEERLIQGVIVGEVRNRPVLPISHTLVSGVDTFDGHLSVQATDVRVRGRHQSLDISRSYSSGGLARERSGWSWTFNAVITRGQDSQSNIFNVLTPDGSSQGFTTSDQGRTFSQAQRGYHTKLERDPSGAPGQLVFTDKASNKLTFKALSSDTFESGPWPIASIVEPHGDTIRFFYNKLGQVAVVSEFWGQDPSPKTTAVLEYQAFKPVPAGEVPDPSDMALRSVTLNSDLRSLNLKVLYEHDAAGDLKKVTRVGQNLPGQPAAADASWEYEYEPSTGADAHRLNSVIDPDGHKTSYTYYADKTYSSSEGDISGRSEYVHTVTQTPGAPAPDVVTTFIYGPRSSGAPTVTTTVKDARGNDTVYTMNEHGGVTSVVEPLSRTSSTEWDPTHLRPKHQVLPGGLVKDYQYDVNGNVLVETVTGAPSAAAPLVATTASTYDLKFNKPRSMTDANTHTTSWEIDPTTGDVTMMTNAVSDQTKYAYDPTTGLLQTEIDPRGVVSVYTYTGAGAALGMWTRRVSQAPAGSAGGVPSQLTVTAERDIDGRGRITRESDGLGHVTLREYDGLDRETLVRRIALVSPSGAATPSAADEVTSFTYTKAGQVKTSTNPLSATTTNTLDGLNRVIATSTPVTGGTPVTLSTAAEYDANGNVIRATDARGVVRVMAYDELNRLTSVSIEGGPATRPAGVIQSFTYKGPTDLKETETDLSGNVTSYVYDSLFRMSERHAPEPGFVERFAYDLAGNPTEQTDANGRVTRTDYDALNRPTRVTHDLGGASEFFTETKYEESATSHVLKTEEYDSQKKLRVKYANDLAGRVRARVLMLEGAGSVEARALTAANPGEAAVNGGALALFGAQPTSAPVRYVEAYGYELGANLGAGAPAVVALTMVEPSLTRQGSGRSVLVGMDGLGREVLRKRGSLAAVETKYNGLGGKKEVKDENGNVTKWDYDTAGRLIRMTDGEDKSAGYKVDGAGLRIEETDRRGVIKTFGYDNLGRVTRSAAAGSLSGVPWSEDTEYLDATRQLRVTDARGSITLTTMDGLGRPRTIKQFGTEDGGGDRTREITYDRADKHTESDWLGRVTTFAYDGLHRVTKATDPAPFTAQTVETTYDDANNRTVVKDRKGNRTVTQHDSLGRVVWIRRGTCDVNGTPGVGCETVERNEFDGSGNKVLTADGREHKTRFEYDGANRLVAREEAYEAVLPADTTVIRFELDNGGRVTKEFHGRLAATVPAVTRVFDKVNRVASEKNGEGEETIYGYDGEGNRTSVKPPGRPAMGYAYDELGKLTSVTMPPTADYATPAVTRYTYDKNRNKKTQEDARGNTTVYDYDRANRLISTLEPGNLSTAVKYDANGNALEVADPNGQKSASTYDELNRKKTTTYTAGPTTQDAWRQVTSETFEYDQNNNPLESHRFVASGTDPPQDRSIIRTFDALDRQLTETSTLPDGGTKRVEYEYYANGTRKSVIDPDTRRTAYDYDAQNRVKTMVTTAAPDTLTSSEGTLGVTTYAYYPDDLVKEVISPNQVKATSTYDKAGRLLTLTNAAALNTVSSYVYEYDAQRTGNRTKQTETNYSVSVIPANAGIHLPETTLYTYDEANRLKSVTYPQDATYPAGRVVTYTYDKAGNREHEVESVPATAQQNAGAVIVERAGSFDINNRLSTLTVLSVTDNLAIYNPAADGPGGDPNSPSVTPARAGVHSSLSLVYDNNGNEISRSATPFGGGATVITASTYDLTDHLVEQKRDADIIARHEYDAEGRRTKKIGEDGIRQYVYDDTSLLAEYDTNGVEMAKYDYGGDRLIRLTRLDEGTRYFSFDGLGSVTNLTTATEVAASYHLDAWGNYRFTSELAPSKNRFGFTGHYWDNEAGLYYAKARFYDPQLARFTQADSFLGNIDDPPSLHRYAYAADNPTTYVDPTGHAVVQATETERLRQMIGVSRISTPRSPVGKPGESPLSITWSEEQQQALSEQVEALSSAGASHSASITIEEGDFDKGRLNRNKVLAAFYRQTGRFAAEIDGLDQALMSRLSGSRAGDVIGVSDLFSDAYDYSVERATEEARKASPLWDITGTGHETALAELGRQGLAPPGFAPDHAIGAGMAAMDVAYLVKLGGALAVSGLAKVAAKTLPQLPEGYFYREVGGRTQVVRGAGRAGELPALHLENGTLQIGPSPGAARSIATRSAYLRQLDAAKYPKWMKAYLEKGEVPPGFTVHHKKALFDGGTDTVDNLVLQAEDLHTLRHRYYRPGGRFPSINPPK